jgi:hypothetical protein
MKKIIFVLSITLITSLFSSCVVLPDGNGGYYSYAISDDEIEYKRPDGSKITVGRDGNIKPNRP